MKLIFSTLLFILVVGSVKAQLWQTQIVPSFVPLPPPGYQSELKGYDVQETSDGNYVFAGSYRYGLSPNYTYTPVLTKVDGSTGNILWTKEYLGFSSDLQEVSLLVKPNGNLLLAGLNNKRIFLIETDFYGNLNSSQQYISTCESVNNVNCNLQHIRLRATNDGNYIIGVGAIGGLIGIPNPISQLMKIAPNHSVIWNKDFYKKNLVDFQPTSDGGYVMAGSELGAGIVYKLDMNGDSLWQKVHYNLQWPLSNIGGYPFNSIKETADKGFVVASSINGVSGVMPLVFKLDSTGTNALWQMVLGNNIGKAEDVIIDPNGNYVVTGTKEVPHGGVLNIMIDAAYITKLGQNGAVLQDQVFDNMVRNNGRAVRHTSDGNFIVAGSRKGSLGNFDKGYLVKTGYTLNSIVLEEENAVVNVFPNPFQEQTMLEVEGENYTNLKVELFDVLGRQVDVIASNSNSQVIIKRNGLNSGVYYFKLIGDRKLIVSGKLIAE